MGIGSAGSVKAHDPQEARHDPMKSEAMLGTIKPISNSCYDPFNPKEGRKTSCPRNLQREGPQYDTNLVCRPKGSRNSLTSETLISAWGLHQGSPSLRRRSPTQQFILNFSWMPINEGVKFYWFFLGDGLLVLLEV